METTRTIMWAVLNKHNAPIYIRSRRRDAIFDLTDGSTLSWRQWKRQYGVSVAKVSVTAVQ